VLPLPCATEIEALLTLLAVRTSIEPSTGSGRLGGADSREAMEQSCLWDTECRSAAGFFRTRL